MAGTLLPWEEIQKHSPYVKDQAIRQFIRLFHEFRDRKCTSFKWGDEMEYIVIRLDHTERKAGLILNNRRVVSAANSGEDGTRDILYREKNGSNWTIEMVPWMVESTPGEPFTGEASDYISLEKNLRFRREQVNNVLTSDNGTEEVCLSLCAFPRLGFQESLIPIIHPTSSTATVGKLEEFVKKYHASQPRYRGVAENCTKRSGNYSRGYVPVFEDEFTDMTNIPSPMFITRLDLPASPKRGHIPIASTTLSWGFPCLQFTIQGADLQEARLLHDQLVPLCPIMLALSAASSTFNGYLTDWDSRWNILSHGTDSRTAGERGEEPTGGESRIIPRSRDGSVNNYIASCNATSNDVYFPFDEKVYQQLKDGGIDTCLAKHIARQLFQDPIFLVEGQLLQDESSQGHLENILYTNWQSVRLKLPTAENRSWRVEFRPMDDYAANADYLVLMALFAADAEEMLSIFDDDAEGYSLVIYPDKVQLTDFENAAYIIFMVLLTRAILSLGLDFVMPISKVDASMARAPLRDAVKQQKYFFRVEPYADAEERILSEMDIDTIINGGETTEGVNFPGLVPLVNEYLATLPEEENGFKPMVAKYLHLISQRAAGHAKTNAQWIRDFVLKHPYYQRDSVVTERINYDLITLFRDISNGKVAAQHL